MEISADDVDALGLGCDVLGSGGGGSTSAARLILAHHLTARPAVTVLSELPSDAVVACVGAVGSAAIMLESLPSPLPFVRAVHALGRQHRPIEAVLPLEVGGVNGLLAVLAAAAAELPLVDADPMGRAFTQLHRTVLGAAVPLTELAFSSTAGGSAYFEASEGASIERMVRAILPSVGGWGGAACHAGDFRRVVDNAVRGTLSRACALGSALSEAAGGRTDAFRSRGDVRFVFEGTVTEVIRRAGMEAGGVVSLQHRDNRMRFGRLDFANEYVALYDHGELLVAAPEIICVLDEPTWLPVSIDELTVQQRVRILAVDAPPELRTAHAAGANFGLQAHGFSPVGAVT